ncbi:MAG: hypothetical protein C0404_05630 [Verrucomicrobia bacterium]|nr:hypothetical protein [Verrucomicrobiota bacterium]
MVLLAVAVVLLAAPVVWALAGAFVGNGGVTLSHFSAVFAGTGRLPVLAINSLKVVAGSVAVALTFAVPLAFLCFRTDLPFRRAIIFACLLAACIPLYVTATCWMALFGMQFWLYKTWGSAWISGIAYVPLATLAVGVSLTSIDRRLEEIALLDTGRFGMMIHATLPAAAWGIGMAAAVVAAFSAWDITVTDILTVRTFAEEVFTQFQLGAGAGNAAAIAFPAMLVLCVLWGLCWLMFRRYAAPVFSSGALSPRLFELGWLRYVVLVPVLLCVFGFFLLPLGALVMAVKTPGNLLTAWHTAQFELLGTLQVTPIAATIAILIALPLAWAGVRVGRLRLPVAFFVFVLLSVPAPLVGIGLIEMLNRPGLPGAVYDSQAGLVFAYVIRALPFAILAIIPAIRNVPRETEEAAELDGAGWLTKIVSIVLPSGWRSVVVAWLLVFVFSVSEMGASFMVVPPGRATLSTRFFTLIHYGVYPDAAGICLFLIGIVALVGGAAALLVWPGLRRKLGI